MSVLRKLEGGARLGKQELALLSSVVGDQSRPLLARTYHLREASYLAKKFRRTGDPWTAINASGNYRKGGEPDAALEILAGVTPIHLESPTICSALCTTKGGVMRDLGRLDEALSLGEQAHRFAPSDFRPCTLMGAAHVEFGNLLEGRAWYARAEERGAAVSRINEGLQILVGQAPTATQAAMRPLMEVRGCALDSSIESTF